MKVKWSLLIGTVLGGIIGWGLGYLRLPYIENGGAFWVGFSTCLALVLLLWILLFVWNKSALLRSLAGKDSAAVAQIKSKTHLTFGIWMAVFILLTGATAAFLLRKQDRLLERVSQQHEQIQDKTEFIESRRKTKQIFLVNKVLAKLEEELKQNSQISEKTLARLVASTYSLKPYRYLIGDSLSQKKLSPERGQLLLALLLMDMDSLSFARIKKEASFAQADLRGADLRGEDLSGINLERADLQDANLEGIDLSGADLGEANLWGANLNRGNLRESNLRRANLSWAELNEADLQKANMDGADLMNAVLRKTDLREATFKWGKLNGALLSESVIIGADFFRANLIKTDLSGGDLSGARLRDANLDKANLTRVKLLSVSVEKNWLEKLDEWQIQGTKEIQDNYKIAKTASNSSFEKEKHFLEKR